MVFPQIAGSYIGVLTLKKVRSSVADFVAKSGKGAVCRVLCRLLWVL